MSEAVKDMISQALDQDFNNANKTFNDVMTITIFVNTESTLLKHHDKEGCYYWPLNKYKVKVEVKHPQSSA